MSECVRICMSECICFGMCVYFVYESVQWDVSVCVLCVCDNIMCVWCVCVVCVYECVCV